MKQQHRSLTHDERKAAEAAFKGIPFDPQLSESARKIYVGITSAMANKRIEIFHQFDETPSVSKSKTSSKEIQSLPPAKSILW